MKTYKLFLTSVSPVVFEKTQDALASQGATNIKYAGDGSLVFESENPPKLDPFDVDSLEEIIPQYILILSEDITPEKLEILKDDLFNLGARNIIHQDNNLFVESFVKINFAAIQGVETSIEAKSYGLADRLAEKFANDPEKLQKLIDSFEEEAERW